jgi:hypothetical protein
MAYKYVDPSDLAGILASMPTQVEQFNTLANAAGQTLTVAQMLQGNLDRSGAAGVSDTTPTAAQLVAGKKGVTAGDVVNLSIRNRNTGTLTLVAGAGVTLEGTTTILTVNTRQYKIRFTNVTPGSEAVTISGMAQAAN